MIKFNVIVNDEIVDTIEVSDINTLDGYVLPEGECRLERIS